MVVIHGVGYFILLIYSLNSSTIYFVYFSCLKYNFRHDHDGDCRLNIKSQRQQLNSIKNANRPKWSQSIGELHSQFAQPDIMLRFRKTLDNKHELYSTTVITEEFGFNLFVSQKSIQMVKETIPPGERFYVLDGTFRTVPKPYYQLLIIAIEYRNDVSYSFHFDQLNYINLSIFNYWVFASLCVCLRVQIIQSMKMNLSVHLRRKICEKCW